MTGFAPVSGFSGPKAGLDALMQTQHWTLHDLQRTATTLMARLGVASHVADRVLNHTTGSISGVAAVYNRFSYIEERKVALDKLGSFVERLVGHNVVAIRAG
jgi:integrase